MCFFRFLLLLSCVYFNLLEGSHPSLETLAKGRHLEIKHHATDSNLTDIKLTEKNRQELVKEPMRVFKKNLELMDGIIGSSCNTEIDLQKVWAKLRNHPLMLFSECVDPDCPLNRTLNSKPRHLFEEKVLAEAVERATHRKDSSLHLTFFGSSFLLDSLVHLAQVLEKMPDINTLEINLVDSIYHEYITYIKENNLKEVLPLTFLSKDKQNWYNFLTIRFAVFSMILEQLAPNTSVTLRIYGKLGDLSEDLVDGTVKTTSDIVIAGDLFDDGGGAFALHDLIVYGAAVTDSGATLLCLGRSGEAGYKILKLVKQTSADTSRKEIGKITYPKQADSFEKLGKRLESMSSQFKELP